MATINQLVSQLANSLKQPNSIPVRKALRLEIIQVRNMLIRQSFEHHGYVDKGLQQKFQLELENDNDNLKTVNKVPKPVRLTNNNPFHSVTIIMNGEIINLPYIKIDNKKYYSNLPGMGNIPSYDYINGYIYLNNLNINNKNIFVESVFEYPQIIELDDEMDGSNSSVIDDDDEFLLPEDMIPNLKKLVLEGFNSEVIRDTNEPNATTLI